MSVSESASTPFSPLQGEHSGSAVVRGNADSSVQSNDALFKQFTHAQLKELAITAMKANEVLLAETEMFDSYLRLHEDHIRHLQVTQRDSTASPTLSSKSQHLLRSSSRQRADSGSKTRSPMFERLLKLKAEYKCDIVQTAVETVREEQKKYIAEAEQVMDKLKSIIEEAITRMELIKRQKYEFERDVIKGSQKQATLTVTYKNTIYAEKVIRYFEDRMKSMEVFIAKTRLKNVTMRQNQRRMKLLLKQKEEIGDILTEIDFQQLKIENAEYLEKIKDRNEDFFRLKQGSAQSLVVLNKYKVRLHHAIVEANQLKQDSTSRKELIGRLDSETAIIEVDRKRAEVINRKYRKHLSEHKVPTVEEAVTLQASVIVLTKDASSWARKVHIAEMALQVQKNIWHRIKGAAELNGGLDDESRFGKLTTLPGISSTM